MGMVMRSQVDLELDDRWRLPVPDDADDVNAAPDAPDAEARVCTAQMQLSANTTATTWEGRPMAEAGGAVETRGKRPRPQGTSRVGGQGSGRGVEGSGSRVTANITGAVHRRLPRSVGRQTSRVRTRSYTFSQLKVHIWSLST
jgi:hypothetical protein